MEKTRYLFIELSVREGEREHTHHCLHTTLAKNIDFAAERYVSTFWGEGEREDDFWWFDGEITARLEKVVELTRSEWDFLNSLWYQRIGELPGERRDEMIDRQILAGVYNDLKANFRKWEVGCDNKEDTLKLADILAAKHGLRPEKAFEIAREWTGY